MNTSTRVALLSLLGLVGCANDAPLHRPELSIPTTFEHAGAFEQAADEMNHDRWWQVLQEPRLDELMQALAEANPSVQGSHASLSAAEAALTISNATLWPSLNSTVGSTTQGAAAGASSSTLYKVGLSSSWEIDLWGKNAFGSASALAGLRAARFDYQSALLSARASLATTWLNARGLQRQIELSEQLTTRQETIVRLTHARIRAGAASASEADSAESALQSSWADLSAQRLALSQAERAISIACGMAPSEFKMPRVIPPAPIISVQASFPGALLERRPDVLAAKQRMIAADAEHAKSAASILPSLTLGLGLNSQAASFSKLLSSAANSWSLAPAMATTIFDAGLRHANVKTQEANWVKSVANYHEIVLGALSEAEDFLQQAQMLRRETQLRQQAAILAAKASAAAWAQYHQGVISGLTLEQTLSQEVNVKKSALDTQTKWTLAQIGVARVFAGDVFLDSSVPIDAEIFSH